MFGDDIDYRAGVYDLVFTTSDVDTVGLNVVAIDDEWAGAGKHASLRVRTGTPFALGAGGAVASRP